MHTHTHTHENMGVAGRGLRVRQFLVLKLCEWVSVVIGASTTRCIFAGDKAQSHSSWAEEGCGMG